MQCQYMNGAGNDFMVIDARNQELDLQALAIKLCKLKNVDGFLALDNSDFADFKLHFYNADGLRGEMCGNGARCVCRFAFEKGIVGETMTVETDAGIVFGQRLSEGQYRIKLNDPSVVDLHRKEDVAYVELGKPGIPHGIKEVPGLQWQQREELRTIAKALCHDPAFPKGANISFYTWLDDAVIRILTYERGVEDYTLACGTGSAAIAVVLSQMGKLPGGALTAENPGGTLKITLEKDGLYLEGPTEVAGVYEV